ncbi:hypothetical protein E2C01_086186 [Portunus trituberculatus]|uniref:Uncharacterized protein n=1 Tax=Portunus trituberculatus TaxID=210409 RepID=A0A5B7JCS2_PORTR|nr:hypothetical protein [Portunus trituberculatus]
MGAQACAWTPSHTRSGPDGPQSQGGGVRFTRLSYSGSRGLVLLSLARGKKIQFTCVTFLAGASCPELFVWRAVELFP